MRKKLGVILAMILSLLLTASVWADAGKGKDIDYVTDYYMIVQSPDGGIDIHAEPSMDSQKLNNSLIPNGAALRIEGEKKTDDGREWGYTQYHGMNGYVLLDDLKPATLSEAILSDFNLGGGTDVDYDTKVDSDKSSVYIYNGPGEKYGKVSSARELKNGETLHIEQETRIDDSDYWGKTRVDGIEGWVNLRDTEKGKSEVNEVVDMAPGNASQGVDSQPVQGENTGSDVNIVSGQEQPDGETPQGEVSQTEPVTSGDTEEVEPQGKNKVSSSEEVSGKATVTPTAKPTTTPTAKPTATPTPKPTATPTPKPTATPTPEPTATPTPEPTATSTPEPTATMTPTPEPSATPTVEPTPTEEAVATPTAEPTKEATPTEEAAAPTEEAVQEAAGDEVETAKAWYENIWLWIIAGIVLIILLLWLCIFRKK